MKKAMKLLAASAMMSVAAVAAESVRWFDGTWDERGAPEGKLLTDNDGWWGRSVYTGVTYSYETEPASPRDVFKGEKALFGRRLLDGDAQTGWYRPVGVVKKPVAVVFDFKRNCRFTEIDVVAEKSPTNEFSVAFSSDGATWGEAVRGAGTATVSRLALPAGAEGRYMRLEFKATAGGATTWLDEVLAWGDAEVSAAAPEAIPPYPRGKELVLTTKSDAGVFVTPLTDPSTLNAPEYNGTCEFRFKDMNAPVDSHSLLMARNEIETRYFAVVNGTASARTVRLDAPEFASPSLKCEMRIGGLVRVTPPKRRLTAQQKFDMVLTGELPENDPSKLDVLPFFAAGEMPNENFLRKNLANADQVAGFPEAVRLAPGEGAVLMLRFMSDGAAPGGYEGALRVDGEAKLKCSVAVVDCTLPRSDAWIYAWSPFTKQYPFESATRFTNDVALVKALGANAVWNMPKPGEKNHALADGNPDAMFFVRGITTRFDSILRKGGDYVLTAEDVEELTALVKRLRADADAAGVDPSRVMVVIRDEPNKHNAKQFRQIAALIKRVEPRFNVYMNPSFWQTVDGRGAFAPADVVIGALGSFYPELIDVSVPYRTNVEDAEEREKLWCVKRRVNAQYAHAAHRAGRSIAWSSFRYGMDGFAYWCYYSPRGNPWDVRTFNLYAYEVQLVFPLETGAALTPVYEEMREACEDWRILTALRETGRIDALAALLAEFGASYNEARRETCRPYECDFLRLRDKALEAFRQAAR